MMRVKNHHIPALILVRSREQLHGLCVLTSQVSSVGGYHDEGEEPPHSCPHSCEVQGTIVQGLYVLTSQVSSVVGYHDEGEEPPHACPHSCEIQGTIVQGLYVLTSQVSSVGGYHDEGEDSLKNHHMPALILVRFREQ